MRKRTAILVDDDPLWRLSLKALCEKCEEIEVIGEAETVKQGCKLINEMKPDLVFLDVDLGGGQSGFDIPPLLCVRPSIVFVTSHSEYALKAFEIHALHYLLKPCTVDQLRSVLVRLPENADDADEVFVLKERDRKCVVRAVDLLAIVAQGDYTLVHVAGAARPCCVHKSMKHWRDALSAYPFVALDRSVIVRSDAIKEIATGSGGKGAVLTIRDMGQLKVGKSAARRAVQVLKGHEASVSPNRHSERSRIS